MNVFFHTPYCAKDGYILLLSKYSKAINTYALDLIFSYAMDRADNNYDKKKPFASML